MSGNPSSSLLINAYLTNVQYLLDESENTSWLIMAGQGFCILLAIWKVTKTVNVRVQRTNSFIPYRIIFEDKHVLTKTEADTQEYDKIAFVQSDQVQTNSRRTCIGEESLCSWPMPSTRFCT